MFEGKGGINGEGLVDSRQGQLYINQHGCSLCDLITILTNQSKNKTLFVHVIFANLYGVKKNRLCILECKVLDPCKHLVSLCYLHVLLALKTCSIFDKRLELCMPTSNSRKTF